MQLSAAQLSNWLLEALPEAPSVDKADRCFRLFDLQSLRVGSLEQSSSPPLFGSLAEWFDAQRALYATKVPSEAVQVLLRVFLEPHKDKARPGFSLAPTPRHLLPSARGGG